MIVLIVVLRPEGSAAIFFVYQSVQHFLAKLQGFSAQCGLESFNASLRNFLRSYKQTDGKNLRNESLRSSG